MLLQALSYSFFIRTAVMCTNIFLPAAVLCAAVYCNGGHLSKTGPIRGLWSMLMGWQEYPFTIHCCYLMIPFVPVSFIAGSAWKDVWLIREWAERFGIKQHWWCMLVLFDLLINFPVILRMPGNSTELGCKYFELNVFNKSVVLAQLLFLLSWHKRNKKSSRNILPPCSCTGPD